MKYAVIMYQSFDGDTPTVLFDNEEEAKKYLKWLWNRYYKEEQEQSVVALNETECFCEEEYAKVQWVDGDKTEFILTFTSEPDPEFKKK